MTSLTPKDKQLISRRAHGEYGVEQICKSILRAHTKANRNLDDQVYLDFLRVALSSKSCKWEDYAAAAGAVINRHPLHHFSPDDEIPEDAPPPKKTRRRRTKKQETVVRKIEEADAGFERLEKPVAPEEPIPEPEEETAPEVEAPEESEEEPPADLDESEEDIASALGFDWG
jgi:hypothetical protein